MTDLASYRYPAGRLLIFARAPVAGAVKTRLAASIGAAAAARLYRQLVQGTLDTVLQAGLAPVDLYVTPNTTHPFIRSLAQRLPITALQQQGVDLGERMYNALQDTLRTSEFALLIGTDCPVMTATYLHQACRQLEAGKDLVVGPTEDGGYVLIGARRAYRELFDSVPWGSAEVLQATRERAESLGLRYAELGALWDLDTPADLARWHTQQRPRPAAVTDSNHSARWSNRHEPDQIR
ncbi:MAG: TIGR04282 family arsenosugar biosynthesis glycosyltransferase [Gammaproteobacteria bacterium]|nr:MAG: TIGR04282 family arsenosugar biosynthesis glycosyltransferase [Gammaproteobacteria bacterium]